MDNWTQPQTPFFDAPDDAPVLVAVVNDPEDLLRAAKEGWYRIPLAHAPARIGADFLALYQTAAFPLGERWCVRWIAAVQGYRVATRRDLIPEQPDHPRSGERYHRVDLGELVALPHPVPSRRLRRITFIRTTLGRLLNAREINDLWVRTPGQERLWQALRAAGVAEVTEHEHPLLDDLPYTADFALFSHDERVAVVLTDSQQAFDPRVSECPALDYPLARGGWRALFVDPSDAGSIDACVQALTQLFHARGKAS